MSSTDELDVARVQALLRALADHDVDYAVFGAVALGLHRLSRSTIDLDLFIRPSPENVERLKRALNDVFEDPTIAEITSEDLCGDYPAVRYSSEGGFVVDILTRLGEAFHHDDPEIEEVDFEGTRVRVVSPRTLWLMKKDTMRYEDRIDAAALAERFGFEDE